MAPVVFLWKLLTFLTDAFDVATLLERFEAGTRAAQLFEWLGGGGGPLAWMILGASLLAGIAVVIAYWSDKLKPRVQSGWKRALEGTRRGWAKVKARTAKVLDRPLWQRASAAESEPEPEPPKDVRPRSTVLNDNEATSFEREVEHARSYIAYIQEYKFLYPSDDMLDRLRPIKIRLDVMGLWSPRLPSKRTDLQPWRPFLGDLLGHIQSNTLDQMARRSRD